MPKQDPDIVDSDRLDDYISDKSIAELKQVAVRLESRLDRLKNRSAALLAGTILFGATGSLAFWFGGGGSPDFTAYISSLTTMWCFLGVILVLGWVLILHRWMSGHYKARLNSVLKRKRSLERENQTKKAPTKKSYIEQLVEMNNAKLDEYYNQTRENNQNLLTVAISVGLLGFFVVIGSVILGSALNGRIEIVALSTLSGLVMDTFAGAFFIQYGNSTKNMKEYFDSLVSTQNRLFELHASGGQESS